MYFILQNLNCLLVCCNMARIFFILIFLWLNVGPTNAQDSVHYELSNVRVFKIDSNNYGRLFYSDSTNLEQEGPFIRHRIGLRLKRVYVRHGYWNEYHLNGKLKAKGNYYKDRKNGLWEFYTEAGELRRKVIFYKGREKRVLYQRE